MTTEERLEKLERELASAKHLNRWLLAGGTLALAIAVMAGVSGTQSAAAESAGSEVAKVIRANSFVVVDGKGVELASLEVRTGWPTLTLKSEKGDVVRSMLDSRGLDFRDDTGKIRAILRTEQGEPELRLKDQSGTNRASLDISGGITNLCLRDTEGTSRISLGVASAFGSLVLSDADGYARTSLTTDKDGPAITLYDKKHTGRCKIGAGSTTSPDGRTTTYPESSIWLFGPDGKGLWSAP